VSIFQWLMTLPLLALLVLIAYMVLSRRTIVDRDEDGAASEREAEHVIEASRPAPLDEDRPHRRAGV
jgi:hypothetical protein